MGVYMKTWQRIEMETAIAERANTHFPEFDIALVTILSVITLICMVFGVIHEVKKNKGE